MEALFLLDVFAPDLEYEAFPLFLRFSPPPAQHHSDATKRMSSIFAMCVHKII